MAIATLFAAYAYMLMDGHWYRLNETKHMEYRQDVRALIVEDASARNCPLAGAGAVSDQVLLLGAQLAATPVTGNIHIERRPNFLVVRMESGYGLRCEGEVGEPIFGGDFERGLGTVLGT